MVDFRNQWRTWNMLLSITLLVFAAIPLADLRAQDSPTATDALPAVHDSTAEAALRSFYTALKNEDPDRAARLMVSAEPFAEWIDAQVKMSAATRRFSTAVTTQLGEEGRKLRTPGPADRVLQHLETNKPDVQGDTATWAMNPNNPLRLKNIDGHWKLDLESDVPVAQLKRQNSAINRMASSLDLVAADIEAGKLETVADIRDALRRRQMSLLPGAKRK